jgi:uncharacterized membrane protein YkvA (DUF1232 family)
MIEKLRRWALELKSQLMTLWFCRSHPDTPLSAKILAAAVVAYAFSPIDLIPDFIPVLGYLDDLILVPLGIYLVLKLLPRHVITASREKADMWIAQQRGEPKNYYAATAIIAVWLGLAYLGWAVFRSMA